MEVADSYLVWIILLHVGAAGAMATVATINAQWWWQDRSQRWLAAVGLLCLSVALTLVVGSVGLSFPEAGPWRALVPVRAILIGLTTALFLRALGARVPLPAPRAATTMLLVLPLIYAAFGLFGTVSSPLQSYTFQDGSPWPRIQPFGGTLIAVNILLFVGYVGKALLGLRGSDRRGLAAAVICILAVLSIPPLAGPGVWTEAATSLWTLPIAILLAWWCSDRVQKLQGSLTSAEAGRRHAEFAVQYQARHDGLTGLPNRDGGAEVLQALLDAADPAARLLVTKIRINGLDHFRAAAGPHTADLVVRAFVGHLVSSLPADVALARVDESTFLVVTSLQDDLALADLEHEAQQSLAMLGGSSELPRDLSMSVGIALSRPGSTAWELLQDAGIAVMAAGQTRRGVQVYRPELRDQIVHRARITRLLSVAVERDEFELHYQPVLDTVSLGRVGVEALVRWRHHGRLHSPGEWIPIAEEQGLMPAIGLHVLRLAVRDHAAVGCPIAVNVSAHQLADPDFVDQVIRVVGDLPSGAIVFEITESAVMADLNKARQALNLVREHGFLVALDDFGTEYSSLSRLATVPFDILKIDRSFVAEVLSPQGRAIVTAIQALARSLGKTTVAEGIETDDQLRALTDIGADRVQGFLTGRPIPLADLLSVSPLSTASAGRAGRRTGS